MTKHYEIRVSGQVQAVGFRYNAQKMAHTLGITGFAQNLPDGALMIYAEGEEASLQQFLEWCQNGPDAARVSKVEYHIAPPQNYTSFDILG